jgi:hypothetical protein
VLVVVVELADAAVDPPPPALVAPALPDTPPAPPAPPDADEPDSSALQSTVTERTASTEAIQSAVLVFIMPSDC